MQILPIQINTSVTELKQYVEYWIADDKIFIYTERSAAVAALSEGQTEEDIHQRTVFEFCQQ